MSCFIPKCRRKTFYGELRQHLGELFRRLAQQKPDRTRSSDAGPCSYDDFDTTKIAVLQVVGLIKGENAIHLARVYGEKKRNFPGKGVLRVDRR